LILELRDERREFFGSKLLRSWLRGGSTGEKRRGRGIWREGGRGGEVEREEDEGSFGGRITVDEFSYCSWMNNRM